MPISIGKLSLYVAGAGWESHSFSAYTLTNREITFFLPACSIRPTSTIPICLDLGTNNQQFLDDPLYLGLRRRRVPDAEMTEFMEEFMREMRNHFPKLLVQFEVSSFLTAREDNTKS